MGRDAFFNTGLERRFVFTVQESSDIRYFGGVNTTTKTDLDYGKYSHSWSYEKDAQGILITLKYLIEDTPIAIPDFSSFSEDLDGTHALRQWLRERSREYIEWIGAEEYYKFELGCLIYHQLKYMPELKASYHP